MASLGKMTSEQIIDVGPAGFHLPSAKEPANLALRMVRAGTNCLTVLLCHDVHEEPMLSVQDFDAEKANHLIEMPKDGKTVRRTGTQIRANHGVERVDPRHA
jgi:hypothetical protein